jgi:hypothetical protein
MEDIPMFEILGMNKVTGKTETIAWANSYQEANLIVDQELSFYAAGTVQILKRRGR